MKALRRLAAKLGVTADFLETGSQLAPDERRELHLADLELAMRLSDPSNVEEQLDALLDDALTAADRPAALRARCRLRRSQWIARSGRKRRSSWRRRSTTSRSLPSTGTRSTPTSAGPMRSPAAPATPSSCTSAASTGLDDAGGDPALEARYATLLSYALSDMGELGRAEDVVGHALARLDETHDPYMRVRLYWSMARLAHAEGRASVALTNVRKAIALLQATDDTLHLARAHILAADITLRARTPTAPRSIWTGRSSCSQPPIQPTISSRSRFSAPASPLCAAGAGTVTLARRALELNAGQNPVDDGRAFATLGDGLALESEPSAAQESYRRAAEVLEANGRWRDAANACRAWARILRESQDEEQAMDVLERGGRARHARPPVEAHAER